MLVGSYILHLLSKEELKDLINANCPRALLMFRPCASKYLEFLAFFSVQLMERHLVPQLIQNLVEGDAPALTLSPANHILGACR